MFAAIALSLIGLGVGATDSNSIVVRIDGKETPVILAGVSGGSERGTAFLQCLVAGRVVHVKGSRGAATVMLLDDTSVAAHVAEFLQTNTSSDPCTIGKGAYQPLPLHEAAAAAVTATTPLPVVIKKGAKPAKREGHVSFSSGKQTKEAVTVNTPMPGSDANGARYVPAPQQPAPYNQPTIYSPPKAQPYKPPTIGTYNPATAKTDSSLSQGQPEKLEQHGTEEIEHRGTEPMPTTTYPPQPPPS